MRQAALYARVSTDLQEKEETIRSQLAAVARYAEEKGFRTSPALTYTDEGYSGSHLDRPALDELRDHAREGRFDVLVVLCPDRLARKYAYQVLLLEELGRTGTEIHFCERPLSDSPDDQLLLQIQGAVAEYERAKIIERSRRGRLHRARMGELAPGRVPYGYRRAAKRYGGDGQIHIDEEPAAVVRQIFEWYDEEGSSLCGVTSKLNRSPFKTWAGNDFWSPSTVRNILRCEWYIGKAYYNRRKITRNPHPYTAIPSKKAPRNLITWRPEAEWIEVAVPAILDEELFRRVQARFEENRRFARRRLQDEEAYLLRGLLKCGECGAAYVAKTSRYQRKHRESVFRYYGCGWRSNRPLGIETPDCTNETLRSDGADGVVWTTVLGLLLDSDSLNQGLSSWIEQVTSSAPGPEAPLLKAQARLEELRRQRERLTDAYQSGALPLDLFRSRMQAIESKHLAAREAVTRLESEQLEVELLRSRAAAAKQAVELLRPKLLEADFNTRQTLLRLLVKRIVVRGHHLEIHLLLPVSSLSNLTSEYSAAVPHPSQGGARGGLRGEDGALRSALLPGPERVPDPGPGAAHGAAGQRGPGPGAGHGPGAPIPRNRASQHHRLVPEGDQPREDGPVLGSAGSAGVTE